MAGEIVPVNLFIPTCLKINKLIIFSISLKPNTYNLLTHEI